MALFVMQEVADGPEEGAPRHSATGDEDFTFPTLTVGCPPTFTSGRNIRSPGMVCAMPNYDSSLTRFPVSHVRIGSDPRMAVNETSCPPARYTRV